jgi:HK97 family phage major capsid protein
MAEIEEKQKHLEEIQKRYDNLKAEHDRVEKEQRVNVAVKNGQGGGLTEKEVLIKAKANFYRAALTGGDVKKAYEGLGAIPVSTADLGMGDNLLPTTMSNELITEPDEENSLR